MTTTATRTTTGEPSLYNPAPRPAADVRLYCIPPSTAGAGYYAPWSEHLPETVELLSVQLPGRGRRSDEPSFTDSRHLATALADVLVRENDSRPYALFGHSLGALMAFETVGQLRREQRPAPALLALSALPAPHTASYRAIVPSRMTLGARSLPDLVGPLPEEFFNNPEIMAAFGAPLLADMLLALQYRHREEPPVECPVALYGGHDDPLATPDDVATWNDLATTPATPKFFPGNHSYPLEQAQALTTQLVRDLQAALR